MIISTKITTSGNKNHIKACLHCYFSRKLYKFSTGTTRETSWRPRTCSIVPFGTEMAEDTRLTWRVRGYHFVTLLIRSVLYKALLSAF